MTLLRWSLGYLRDYRWRVASLAALSGAEVALRVSLPWPMKDAPILILDEPTSALDTVSESLVLSTHELLLARSEMDRQLARHFTALPPGDPTDRT